MYLWYIAPLLYISDIKRCKCVTGLIGNLIYFPNLKLVMFSDRRLYSDAGYMRREEIDLGFDWIAQLRSFVHTMYTDVSELLKTHTTY